MAELIARHAPVDGMYDTPISALGLIRSAQPTEPLYVLHQSAVCIIAQGRKKVFLADQVYEYDASKYLVVSVDLPMAGHVVQATPDAPYLCARLDLDAIVLAAVTTENGQSRDPRRDTAPGLLVSPTTPDITDAMIRLLQLLDTPADIPFLAPMIQRELYYRLMLGDQGEAIRRIAHADSKLQQISRAIGWIKQHYSEPFSVDTVAAEARMGVSAFHQYFKQVTHLSPLQYQKQLRLQEARRLMLGNALDAAQAGYEVGYESASQFTREYSRLFGAPPARDAARLRAQPQVMMGG
jgi:AraC-like DNA-binding protein